MNKIKYLVLAGVGGSDVHTAGVRAGRRLARAPFGSTGCVCYLKYLEPEVYQIWEFGDLGIFI